MVLYGKSPSDRGDLRSFLQLSLNEWLKMVAIRLEGHRLCGRYGVLARLFFSVHRFLWYDGSYYIRTHTRGMVW